MTRVGIILLKYTEHCFSREIYMLNLHSAGLLYLKFDYALKYKKKLTLLNSLLSVGVFGLDFFFRSKRYRALSLVFLSGGEVVNAIFVSYVS